MMKNLYMILALLSCAALPAQQVGTKYGPLQQGQSAPMPISILAWSNNAGPGGFVTVTTPDRGVPAVLIEGLAPASIPWATSPVGDLLLVDPVGAELRMPALLSDNVTLYWQRFFPNDPAVVGAVLNYQYVHLFPDALYFTRGLQLTVGV